MNKIKGGAFLIARKMFESDLWLNKPASWKVIWIYILGKVNHTPHNGLEAGEGYFNFSKECKLIDMDCTPDKIKKFIQYAKQGRMGAHDESTNIAPLISTRRSTRGMIIKVLNYKKYQDLSNFRSTGSDQNEAREKHETSTTIYNNDNNGINDKREIDFSKLKKEEDERLQRELEEFEKILESPEYSIPK